MTEREIFLAVLDLPDPAARAQYLDGACGGDPARRARIESLLLSHDAADSFLDNPAVNPPAPDPLATQELGGAATPNGDANEADADLMFLAPPRRADSLGRLGHYEMIQVLGRGGFGIVFRAFDETLQRVVAVKVMAPQIATLSPARKRFLREAQSSAQVRHENVVQVYEVGEQPLPYLAMEFIPGETLQQKLDRTGPLEVSEVLRVGRQIAEGLSAAHACDLIHRDIKPANVLIEGGPQQRVKITDFGLARAADDASISQSGIIAGTPMFMAPEQALGHKIDQRADLFSLGSVLYQMASGRPPFRAPSALAVLKRVAEETPRPIPEIIPETPAWLCAIIAKLHAKNPDDRFQSAREIADVLADCEAQLKAHAKIKDFSRIPRGKPRRSGLWKWAASAAVLLLSVIALAAMEFAGLTHWFRTPTADPDRKAAEYVLSIGGQVQVDGRDRNINAAAELPRDPFRLTWVGLKDINQVSETGLANFKDCQNLTFLGLFDTSVSDEGLANFQNCTKLTFLNMSRTKISDAGLANFKNCTELTTVVLNETKVSDAGLSYLKTSKKLTKLFLQKTNVTAAGIDELKKALPLCKIEWDSGVMEALQPTFINSIGMEFVIVPKGKSWLGGGKDKLGDQEVVIPADFYLGKYEVTQEEWEKVMGENPSWFSRSGGGKDAVKDVPDADLKRFPVENVSWDQCQIFVAKLNRLEKETGWVYRLPKETEWEYACRGGAMANKADSAFDFYFAKPTNTLLMKQANFGRDKGLNRTCKVGSYAPNMLGLYDMHANAWEWCDDTEESADGVSRRTIRGGSWNNPFGNHHAAKRNAYGSQNSEVGLRLACVPSGAPSPEAKTPPAAVAPFTDADVQRIAALPAAEQVEEVRKELMRRNPGYDGKLEHKIEDGVVREFGIVTDQVSDIAPIRVFNALRVLNCSGTFTNNKPNGLLADLTPLEGMNLAGLTHLDLARTKAADAGMVYFKECKDLTSLRLDGTKVTDEGLACFKDCKGLTSLRLDGTKVTDTGLAHFKDCKNLAYLNTAWTKVTDTGLANFKDCKNLTWLYLESTRVSDAGLAHFKGMPLKWLGIHNTAITDLTPLQGMPLEDILLTPKNITKGMDILRDVKSLKTIGIYWNQSWPAAEFWERYDKGEFKE
jgi:serine/threonine protein kinase/formylglycine-generating enzyme required for sulfatase activity